MTLKIYNLWYIIEKRKTAEQTMIYR